MDLDKILSRAAIAVPTIHVVACSTFLLGYSLAFGEMIETLFSVADFFRVSLQQLAMMYVVGLGLPVSLILFRHKVGLTYRTDKIMENEDEAKRNRLIEQHHRDSKKMSDLIALVGFLSIAALFLKFHYHLHPDFYLSISVAEVSFLPLWIKLAGKAGYRGKYVEIGFVSLVFFTSVMGLGLDAGSRDRHAQFEDQTHSLNCGAYRIVNSVGDRFVAIAKDNVLRVIDDKCEPVFAMTPVEPYKSGTLTRHIWDSVRKYFADAHRSESAPTDRPSR